MSSPDDGRGGAVKVIAAGLFASGLLFGALATGAGASKASDQAQAKKHLLVISDLPKGWKTEKRTGGGGNRSNIPGAAQLASCLGVPSKLINPNPPQSNSPYFQNKDGSQEVQDSVSNFPSTKSATEAYDAVANAKTPACMTTLMNNPSLKSQIASSGGKGTTVGAITVTATDPARYGTGTAGFTMSIPITSRGYSIATQITSLYFTQGRLGQQITFYSYGEPFPTTLSTNLTSIAVGRL